MSITSELLFNYLRNIFTFTPQDHLDLDQIEEDYVMLAKGLMLFADSFYESNDFAKSLAKGDLGVVPPPSSNHMAGPLKSLHASLIHLTWQSKQVAKGDYRQRVDFMGEFANSFNTMIEQLAERQQKLEEEVQLSNKHAQAMERGNMLLSNLMYHIPQQIFVVSVDKREILLFNDMAKDEIEKEPDYVDLILEQFPEFDNGSINSNVEVSFGNGDDARYLHVNSYPIEWEKNDAVALIITDVSVEKKQMKKLEVHAFYDALTGLYNRFYGMLTLNDWIIENRQLSLVFIDLDNLKFINDKFGHEEGDKYITTIADYLRSFSDDAVTCRLGGDEFMMLIPNIGFDDTQRGMDEIQFMINNDPYLRDKEYIYSISFGIVEVGEGNNLAPGIILSIADERMYEHKRARKMNRRTAADPSP